MKDRIPSYEQPNSVSEPWPATETRWPSARWMSPWAFEGDEPEGDAVNDDDEADWERRIRH